jgi:hypothetical protein
MPINLGTGGYGRRTVAHSHQPQTTTDRPQCCEKRSTLASPPEQRKDSLTSHKTT